MQSNNMFVRLLTVVMISVILALVKPVPGDDGSNRGVTSTNLSNEIKLIYDELLTTLNILKKLSNKKTQPRGTVAYLGRQLNSEIPVDDKIKVMEADLLNALDNLNTSRSELAQAKRTIADLEIKCNSQSSQQFAVNASTKFDVAQGRQIATLAFTCGGSMEKNQSQCVSIANVCYCFVKTQLSWVLANDFCITNDMSLLSIQTKSDQAVVSDTLMPLVLGVPISKKIGVWTSGSYNPELKTFAWSSTQKPFTFVNWFYGQPNTNNTNNQCIRIRIVPESLKDGKWATLSCDQWLPFICQK